MVYTWEEVIESLRQHARKLGSQARLARELDLLPNHLSMIMSGERGIPEGTLNHLGLKEITLYVTEDDSPEKEKDNADYGTQPRGYGSEGE